MKEDSDKKKYFFAVSRENFNLKNFLLVFYLIILKQFVKFVT